MYSLSANSGSGMCEYPATVRIRTEGTMLTVEACRCMAAAWTERAEAAVDPNTRASLARVAEEWTSLAEQIARQLRPLASSSSAGRSLDPMERAARGDRHGTGVDVADILRERLHLGSDADSEVS